MLNKKILYLSFLPITIKGISLNFFYIFLFFSSKKIFNFTAFVYILYATISFLIGLIYFIDDGYMLNQLISYLIYISMISLLFLKFNFSYRDVAKIVVILSFLYSIFVLFNILIHPQFSISNPYFIKSGLRDYIPDWPQRYSVLLVFSFIYCLDLLRHDKKYLIVVLTIGAVIFLSFTRAAYLSLFFGILLYYIMNLLYKYNNSFTIKNIFLFSLILFAILTISLTNESVRDAFIKIFDRTLLSVSDFLFTGQISDSSDSKRLHIYTFALETLTETNFITGTGFAGIYLFSSDYGSLHSQYFDILFKTGLLGLCYYLFLWFKILKFYFTHSLPVFAGLFSIFIFGFFHETSKLTYVAVLFFVLLNFALNHKKGA